MNISDIKNSLGDYAKDIKLNLSSLFSNPAGTDLTMSQFYGTALAVAYSLDDQSLSEAVESEAGDQIDGKVVEAAKLAATLMGMNNIYYRFVHLSSDKQFAKMPAGLRMNGMANPGVDKVDFELFSLAVSALNGCGMCIDAHVGTVLKEGVSAKGVQSAIRIAAVMNAVKVARQIG